MSGSAKPILLASMAAGALLASCAPVQQLHSAASAGSSLLGVVTTPSSPASLSPVELRQLQSREFATSKATAHSSVMTVLLDLGYRVLSADLSSGLITAAAPSNSRLRLDPAGVVRSTQTPLASVFIDQRSADTVQIRINFAVGRNASGQLGEQGERHTLDASLYGAFFVKIGQEIMERTIPAAPASVVQPNVETLSPPNHSQTSARRVMRATDDQLADQDGQPGELERERDLDPKQKAGRSKPSCVGQEAGVQSRALRG
jgi:hypothetical protein